MVRINNPEKTIQQILDVSTELFLTKGYEKTTIQDIINTSQLSKGAIYHHFKSKEAILDRIINNYSEQIKINMIETMSEIKARNACEKLQKFIAATLVESTRNKEMNYFIFSQLHNTQFLLAEIQTSVFFSSKLIAETLEDGIKDGSIETQHTTEVAEITMVLLNIWMSPFLFPRNIEETKTRLITLQLLLSNMGANILTDETIELCLSIFKKMKST